MELHVGDNTDARRLHAQRRWFGITYHSELVPENIKLAKSLGAQAWTAVQELLSEPFTVHTSFADGGGGDGRYKRIYGFITLADGRDLAAVLAPPTEMLDINTAARDELLRIPGIGEHLANLLIEHRP
mgnify:FL=1